MESSLNAIGAQPADTGAHSHAAAIRADTAGLTPASLDDSTLTPKQRYTAVIALFGLFLDGYDLLVLSGALLGIRPEFHLKPIEVGMLGASAFVGMVVGSLIAGPLTDRFGRKPVFLADMLLFAITAVLFLFVQTPIQLLILRFIIGVAIGGDMPTSLAIVTEFVPKDRRGRFLALGNGYWIGGAVAGGLVSIGICSFVDPQIAWRWILASGLIPSLILLVLRHNTPETPRWLLAQGRDEESAQVLRSVGAHTSSSQLGRVRVGRGLRFASLYQSKQLLRALITMSVFWAVINFVGSGILLYTPTVIKALVTPSALTALQFSTAVNTLVVLANIVGSVWIIDRLGRRPMALVPSVVIFAGLVAMAFASSHPYVVMAGFAVVTILNSGFIVGSYYTWGAELFPTSVRGSALGISNAAGKFGSVLGVLQFPILFAHSPKWSFLLLAGLVLVNVLMLSTLTPETKGTSLDELEGGFGEVPAR